MVCRVRLTYSELLNNEVAVYAMKRIGQVTSIKVVTITQCSIKSLEVAMAETDLLDLSFDVTELEPQSLSEDPKLLKIARTIRNKVRRIGLPPSPETPHPDVHITDMIPLGMVVGLTCANQVRMPKILQTRLTREYPVVTMALSVSL